MGSYISQSYTKDELKKNFAIPTVIFSPDYSDPQVRQAMLMQGMNSVNNMFGMPQIEVKNVDFATDSNIIDEGDLDNPAFTSELPDEDMGEIQQEAFAQPEQEEPNEPDPQPEEDRTADFQCSRCGTIINEKVYEYSINKFGEPLCIKCKRGGGRR